MGERLTDQPQPFIVGKTESLKGSKTHFEVILIDANNRALLIGDKRIQGLDSVETFDVNGDIISFSSPINEGVLVCKTERKEKKELIVTDEQNEFPAYTFGFYADNWFQKLVPNIETLQVVARIVPNL